MLGTAEASPHSYGVTQSKGGKARPQAGFTGCCGWEQVRLKLATTRRRRVEASFNERDVTSRFLSHVLEKGFSVVPKGLLSQSETPPSA